MIYTVTLNPAIDYVMYPLSLDMGFTNRSKQEEIHVGGNGINICCLLNELDTPNVALGIAAGFTGDYLIKRLQEKGVSCNFVRLDKGNTRINVKLNGIVMTMVNGMGPKIPQSKVDELLARIEAVTRRTRPARPDDGGWPGPSCPGPGPAGPCVGRWTHSR